MDITEIFGPVIHSYTRAQAIQDGALIDVSELAAEAGIRFPVAMTAGLWADCVAWSEADNDRKGTLQDETGRLWDVLNMARFAMMRSPGDREVRAEVRRVPRKGRDLRPLRVHFDVVCGPGDSGEPVITLLALGED